MVPHQLQNILFVVNHQNGFFGHGFRSLQVDVSEALAGQLRGAC
jgi:hypothetical protein